MTINVEKRREWLRALHRFKYGIKVRAKIGVIEELCKEVGRERKSVFEWEAPHWEHDQWVSFLYKSMRDEQFPHKLLKGFVQSAQVTFFSKTTQPSVQAVLDVVDEVLSDLSVKLREKFGVFNLGDEHDKEGKDSEVSS